MSEIVHFGRLECQLWRTQIQRIYFLINIGFLVIVFSPLLLPLILPYQAFLEDTRCDTKHEFVLFNLLLEVVDDASLRSSFALDVDTEGAKARLLLL